MSRVYRVKKFDSDDGKFCLIFVYDAQGEDLYFADFDTKEKRDGACRFFAK